jgi:hypothetical protein
MLRVAIKLITLSVIGLIVIRLSVVVPVFRLTDGQNKFILTPSQIREPNLQKITGLSYLQLKLDRSVVTDKNACSYKTRQLIISKFSILNL